jgi:hypothetical protein
MNTITEIRKKEDIVFLLGQRKSQGHERKNRGKEKI